MTDSRTKLVEDSHTSIYLLSTPMIPTNCSSRLSLYPRQEQRKISLRSLTFSQKGINATGWFEAK